MNSMNALFFLPLYCNLYIGESVYVLYNIADYIVRFYKRNVMLTWSEIFCFQFSLPDHDFLLHEPVFYGHEQTLI